MQENSEEQEDKAEKNDSLLSDFAQTKRQSRSLYRHWTIISKKSTGNSLQSQGNVFSKISASSIPDECAECNRKFSSGLIEDRADEIVRHIEQNHALVVDNLRSTNNRLETLREMTEYLTLKRSVKRKLIKSLGSTNQTLGFSKRLKYKLSIFLFQIPVSLKHFFSSFELWYSSLKVIEGHFGSNVASYFKFLRKLFLLNACIFILMFFFVMTPQLLLRFIQYVDHNQDFSVLNNDSIINGTNFLNSDQQTISAPLVMLKANPYEENGEFRFGNVFTGEGFLTNTILFYGYYANISLKLVEGYSFNIPASYFFTSTVCYGIIFFFLFTSVAVSYRKCYIEASGGIHNTFTNKIFCGWDFGIATKQSAELKSRSIYIDLKEILDELSKPKKKKTCVSTLYTTAISFSLNGLLLFSMVAGGMYSWKYLDQQMTEADTATTMMMWLILTLVVAVAPVLFSFITHIEGFESPSTALYMTLIRTFTLYTVVIAVVVAYRLNRAAESECWETVLGQDMFRLVVLDFIFGSVGITLSEFIRYRIFIKMWKGIGCPEFDIARSTMNLVYNQTLFYIGLFFSPVLALLITIKLFIIFYVKKWGAIYNCRPFAKPWKASQAHTVYLSIAFLAFFCVIIAFGYVITSVKTSNCGPFRGKKFMYESILEEILAPQYSKILTVFYYITRPGVVGIVLVAMLLGVYYMRAVALARIHVVKHLRHLLRLKAEDRKFLLNEISKYTKNRDPCNSQAEDFPCSHIKSPNGKLFGGSLPEEETQEKLLTMFRKSKSTFSSMTDLRGENEILKRRWINLNSIFSSSPNISSSILQGDIELNYKYWKEIQNDNDNVYTSISKFKDNIEEDLTKGASDIQGNSLDEHQDAVFGGVSNLNFNPVFTESVPLYSDGEEEYEDVNRADIAVPRSSILPEKVSCEINESDTFTAQPNSTKNYKAREERVPSRISFVLEKKKAGAKKKGGEKKK